MLKTSLDEDRIFIISEFLAHEECDAFIRSSEQAGYEGATIATSAGPMTDLRIRDNARYISDDHALARQLWLRARAFVPARIDRWNVLGLNERFRFYRYDVGQKFAPHLDGSFCKDDVERSHLTFMVYLNDDFTGGETKFYNADLTPRIVVRPERGLALVFQHQQIHEGAPVLVGRKYVLRTDVMYGLPLATV